MKYPAAFMVLVVVWLAPGSPVFGEWPEHGLTLVVSVPQTLPWGDVPNPQAVILKSLGPRLSRELGVPVNLVVHSEGDGILAANAVAMAREDGYILTALANDPALNLVIQGYTPYVWGEVAPVATAWRVIYILVTRNNHPATDLRSLAETYKNSKEARPRLAVSRLEPLGSATLMAMEAARQAGFAWELTKVESLDPEVLLEGPVEAMVLPLADFKTHPHQDAFKVLSILSADTPLGAEASWPNLKSQGLSVTTNTFFAFYLPAKVNWRIRNRLSTAINNTLRLKAMSESLIAAGLVPYLEDSEGVGAILNQEYSNQVNLLKSFGLLEPSRESEPAAE
ncbi:hypothetical protein FACS189460_5300 [Deltaproteobacteria bacterium]|nr:hypothetical protein FACS189460_5300 [Deltaproteobacteria bacterium]